MGMEILGGLSALGGGLVGYLVPFLFVLTIVVFFHELGHFMMARLCGIKVLVFSIGFGPEIAGFNDRYGTRWKISAVPLGGYVKFFGDENAASAPDQAAAAAMTEARKKGQLHIPTCRVSRRRCRGWPDCEFRTGDRDFRRHFRDDWQANHQRACRFRTDGKCGPDSRLQAWRPGSDDQWRKDRKLLRHAADRQH